MADYREFSRQIKEKYPEYKDVDDLKLAKAMLKKYPVYADKVTLPVEFTDIIKASPEQRGQLWERAKQEARQNADLYNEQVKQIGRQRLANRQQWEENHPFVSNIQKSFQPNYRADLVDMENQAKYGYRVPIGEQLKGEAVKAGQRLIPIANWGAAYLTRGKSLPVAGGIQGGVEAVGSNIADNGLSWKTPLYGLGGAGLGFATGGLIRGGQAVNKAAYPFVEPVVGRIGKVGEAIGKTVVDTVKGLPRGLRESLAGISENAYNRIKTSPRGAELSSNSDYLGSNEFMRNTADKLRNGINQFKDMEVKAFAEARDRAIQEGRNTTINTENAINRAIDKLKAKKLLDNNGNITNAGQKAKDIDIFLDDISAYRGNFDVNDLQTFKTNILDDIINYKPPVGQNLSKSTRDLQNIAKELRKSINDELGNVLGEEYRAANKRLSTILDLYDSPNIKDIVNMQNIDVLAGKLKKTGTIRPQAARELQAIEDMMREQGINISDYSLMDDILDYNAAREIQQKVQTGLGGGMANIGRRAAFQPTLENIILPYQQSEFNKGLTNMAQTVGRTIKNVKAPKAERAVLPFVYPTLEQLQPLQGYIRKDEQY